MQRILIPARETGRLVFPVVSRNAPLEGALRHMGHELREDGTAKQHTAVWRGRSQQAIYPQNAAAEKISSPGQIRENSCGLNGLRGLGCSMTGHQCRWTDASPAVACYRDHESERSGSVRGGRLIVRSRVSGKDGRSFFAVRRQEGRIQQPASCFEPGTDSGFIDIAERPRRVVSGLVGLK